MENDNIRCYACKRLLRYYIKGKTNFEKTKFGWCREHNNIVDIHSLCDSFERREKRKRIDGIIQNTLNVLLDEITAIRQLIEEDENEEL